MKILFLLFVLFLSTNLFSQITITSSNNPVPGNSQTFVDCDTAGIVEGNSGANQTWNFTNIVRGDSSNSIWVAASSTPYAAQFPNSNLAASFDTSFYNYYTSSSSSLVSNGFGGPGLVVSYSDPQTYLVYPFSYNSTFTDSFAATFFSGFDIYETGTTTATADAWGTLTLPNGTYSNALRIRSNVITKDSSNPGIPFVSVRTTVSYSWFVAGKKFPVFQISYSNSTLNGLPQTSTKSVDYVPNSIPIGITQLSTSLPDKFSLSQNYPNPFNPSTKIRFNISSSERSSVSDVKLVVYDQLGKEISTLVNENLSPGSYEVDWNASNVSGGVYYYKLISGKFTETKKMILIK